MHSITPYIYLRLMNSSSGNKERVLVIKSIGMGCAVREEREEDAIKIQSLNLY